MPETDRQCVVIPVHTRVVPLTWKSPSPVNSVFPRLPGCFRAAKILLCLISVLLEAILDAHRSTAVKVTLISDAVSLLVEHLVKLLGVLHEFDNAAKDTFPSLIGLPRFFIATLCRVSLCS